MKFSLFAHMERVEADKSHRELYDEFISLCKMADEGGMHAIWSGEHHGMEFTIAPNPFTTLVDLSHHTKNVRLGTGTVIAPFWHPIRLAGEAAMTDVITNGRLDLGIARGAYSYEYERMMPGMDAWEAGTRMREIIPAVKKLWEGDYTHDGEYYKFPKSTSAPKPVQEGGPPMWVAARDPNSFDFAIENHCNVQVTPLWFGLQEIEDLMQKFNDSCEKYSDIPRPKAMLLQHAYVGKDQAACDRASKLLSRFYCYFGAWFKNERLVTQAQIKALSEEEMAKIEMYSPENMKNNLLIGTPKQVIDRLKHYEDLGYDEFSFWIDSGMRSKDKHESLARFIDEVMPAFN